MSLEGRRTLVSSLPLYTLEPPSPPPPRPSLPRPADLAHPIHTRVHPESHFYRAYHMHTRIFIWMPASTKLRTFLPREDNRSARDRSRGARCSRRTFGPSPPSSFSFFFAFYSDFFLPHPPHDTRPEQARERQQRGCKRGGSVSSLARPRERIQRFLFANEGIVGSTL